MKSLKLLLLFLASSHFLFAQTKINGKIVDGKTKTALNAVSVYIPELKRGTISNDQGEFSMENLPKTTIGIQFSRIGYTSVVKNVNLSTSDTIEIEMDAAATELQEVLVTTSNTKLQNKTPFPVNSVSQNEFSKHGSPSLMGNLAYQPGIDKITLGNGIGKPVIRGLSFNQIMLYAQGTRIENQQWDDHHDLGLTDVGVQNVEIVRGPAALIYGADALGGALIFVDRKPAPLGKMIGNANLGYNSNTFGFAGDVGINKTNTKGFFYGLDIGTSSHTSYLQGEGNVASQNGMKDFAFNSKFMNTVAKLNFGFSKKWGVSKVSYSFLNQRIGIVEDESGASNIAEEEDEQRKRDIDAPFQDVYSQIISSENTIFTGKSKVNLNASYQINNRKEYEPLPGKHKELAIGLDLNTATYDFKWTSDAEKQFGVTLGSQGLFLRNTNNGKVSLVPDATVNSIAEYVVFRYDLKKWNFLAGARYDFRQIEAESYDSDDTSGVTLQQNGVPVTEPQVDFKKEYNPFSFSIGSTYQPTKNVSFKINAATGFAAPNYAQLATFGKHEGTYRFERGNENLELEQNREIDLGLNWEHPFVSFNVSGYVNKISNYIYIVNTGDIMERITANGSEMLPIYDYRQNDATISGAEFGFDIHPTTLKWLQLKTSYSVLKGTLDQGGALPYIPSNKFIAEVKLTKERFWKIKDAYFSFLTSNFERRSDVAAYELSSDSYTLFDAYFGGKFKWGNKDVSFHIFCNNIFNKGYYNQLSLVKYIGISDMGRDIGCKLSIPLWISKSK